MLIVLLLITDPWLLNTADSCSRDFQSTLIRVGIPVPIVGVVASIQSTTPSILPHSKMNAPALRQAAIGSWDNTPHLATD